MIRPKPYRTKRWLTTKPYRKPTPYDEEMAGVGRQLDQDLKQFDEFWRVMGEEYAADVHSLIDLALGYLEDVVSEVGFWRAFTQRNQEIMGRPLPFWSLEDYELGEINQADVNYLVWQFLNLATAKFWSPDSVQMQAIAEVVYERLLDAYEYVPETDYYEQFLTLAAEDDFFAVKNKLSWWARGGYLLCDEFGRKLIDEVHGFLEQKPNLPSSLDHGTIAYALQDPYLYTKRSSYAALSTPEWMARVVRASDDVKRDLLAMKDYFYGIFRYEGTEGDQHQFYHTPSGRHYPVAVKDFPIDAYKAQPGSFLEFSLVAWQGKWYMSGLAVDVDVKPNDLRVRPLEHVPYKFATEPQREKMQENVRLLGEAFVETFGQWVVLFEGKEEANQQLNQFLQVYQQKAWRSLASDDAADQAPDAAETDIVADQYDKRGRLGAVMIEGEGLRILPHLPKLVDKLRREEPFEGEEASRLFWEWMGEEHPPQVTHYLLEHEPTQHINWPMLCEIEWRPNLPFLLRYVFPEHFEEPTPQVSAVIEEDASV
jgi:hypothetical protein